MSKHASPVRTFLAVEIPEPVRAGLGEIGSRFEPQRRALKLVNPALMHITVRFLGNVPAPDLDQVFAAAGAGAKWSKPFTLHLTALGAFPNERSPRVLWVGLEKDAGYGRLEDLHGAVEDALVAEGFERETRAFAPHITLARVREDAGSEVRQEVGALLQRVRAETPMSVAFDVTDLRVMRSDLSPAGPKYTMLARYGLGG